ncbi:MAG: mechanosensitive ion channel [Acidobacteria bacterium]|nr:mechanosensitive ion channel [Acidobacteriota bacterium]
MHEYLVYWKPWLWSLGGIVVSVLIALLAHSVMFRIARGLTSRTKSGLDDALVRRAQPPTRLLLPLLGIMAATPALPMSAFALSVLRHILGLLLIADIAWVLIALIDVVRDYVGIRYVMDTNDNLMARRMQTQVQILRHIAVVIILVIAAAVMLMTFPSIRHLGESLFASAGIAALMAGLAARTSLTNLLAGVQIALTQPIRLDDVVIVEGEFGWIEEIRTTYVIVRVWDQRRLVIPLSYFIEKPFQNWTRQTADLLGTVFLYTDYTVPVEEVRQELHRILQTTKLWDGRAWGVQVTDTTEKTIQLRALMSAADAPKAWDLRCLVREKLVEFLQTRYPGSLPHIRAELTPEVREGKARNQPLAAT